MNNKYRLKTIYKFSKKINTKTSYYLTYSEGIRDIVFKDKMKTDKLYITEYHNSKRKPKFKYRLSGNSHISGIDKSHEDNTSTIYTGDIKDRLKDLLLVVTCDDFQTFTLYHIESDEIIKDTQEHNIVNLYLNGYFTPQDISHESQYYFDFMYDDSEDEN